MRVVLFLIVFSPFLALCQQPNLRNPEPVIHVATALNHLTVLEFHEPVTMAAVGSSDFQIERESDKVFVKPTRSGAETDLFVWTASRRLTYELETMDDVKKMNFAIDEAAPETSKSPPSIDTDQLADVILIRALLGAEEIAPKRSKVPKNQVSIRVEQVFRTATTLYIRYEVANHTKRVYRLGEPQARRLEPDPSEVSLADVVHTQLGGATLDRIEKLPQRTLPIAHLESESEQLQPGETVQGVIAIRQHLKSPAMVQLDFGNGLKATVVL